MSQQSKTPDLFGSDSEDPASDPPGGSYLAPDEPEGVQSYGTTRTEERRGETFEYRTRHIEPEYETPDSLLAGRLSQSGDEDVDVADADGEMFGWSDTDEGDLTAEESAMHLTERP